MALVVLQGKVQPEVLEQFKQAQGDSDTRTFNEFVELLLEAYLNPKTKEVEKIPAGYVSPDEHNQALQQAQNEAGQTATAQSLEIDRYTEQIENLKALLAEVENQPSAPPTPAENEMLIKLSPFGMFLVNDELKAFEAKTGTTPTFSELIFTYFKVMKKNGRVDAFRFYSDAQFARLEKQYTPPVNE